MIITIWTGFVLAKNRGITVTRAQISGGIGIMRSGWGFELLAHNGWRRNEVKVGVIRWRNGGGCGRPRLFIIITIWTGFVLAKNRGITVTSAQISGGIGIMHSSWGL